jgi:hypothetical protein
VFERDVGALVAADEGERLVQEADADVGLADGFDDELQGLGQATGVQERFHRSGWS